VAPRHSHFGGGGGGAVSVKSDANAKSREKGRRKRRPRPPWGGMLGGKPIPGSAWNLNKKIDLREPALISQYARMLLLKEHYGIVGRVPSYPIAGVGNADWLPWYQLALAIASD
jgi:hypothetical protein